MNFKYNFSIKINNFNFNSNGEYMTVENLAITKNKAKQIKPVILL